jgi:chromosome partitioning protein
MHRVVILNPKGGSGKTTIATNLAAWFAVRGLKPTLIDLDPQGSSARWVSRRAEEQAAIYPIAAFERSATVTRSWQMRIPRDCGAIVVDTPAAIDAGRFPDLTRGAHSIIVPVMPSDIDINTAAKCIADLLLVAKIRRNENRIAIIANRVRANTLVSQSLMRFLGSLDIPLLATLRDAQNYVRSTETGVSIFEMPRWQARTDVESWSALLDWLASKQDEASREVANRSVPVLIRNG